MAGSGQQHRGRYDEYGLVRTLADFLECGGSYDAAASSLPVHRSTLKYRLKRIREVSDHDLGVPDTQSNLQIAIRAWRTLQALRSPDRHVRPGQQVGPRRTVQPRSCITDAGATPTRIEVSPDDASH